MALKLLDNQTESLHGFTADLLQAVGGLVEEQAGVLEVVLPDERQELFDGEAFLRLAFDPETAERAGARYLAVGSPLTERLLSLADGIGLTARWYINGLRWSQQRAIDLSRWRARFTNARFTFDGVEFPFACHYILFNFQVSYLSDEKREEVRAVAVDAGSLQAAPRLQEGWSRMSLEPRRAFHVSDVDNLPDATRLSAVYERAIQLLRRRIDEGIASFKRRASRHLEMEELRINSFYDDTRSELERRLERTEDPERKKTLQRKIEACEAERAAKLADVAAKHRLRVTVTPLNAAVITQPKVRGRLKVENRYANATASVVLDPLTGELELPSCEVCHEGATSLHLCANGHLTCERCILTCSACKREHCLTCGVGACSVCGRALCAHSQNHCPTCGRVTCEDHKGRCHS